MPITDLSLRMTGLQATVSSSFSFSQQEEEGYALGLTKPHLTPAPTPHLGAVPGTLHPAPMLPLLPHNLTLTA